MKYEDLKKAYNDNPLVFNGALLAVFTHGSKALARPDATVRFQVSGNIIDADMQRKMLDLACELSMVSFNDLMAFVHNDASFHFSKEFAPGLDEEGVCPVCGASVEYSGENEIDDEGGSFPWTRPECGATGREGYDRAFDRHYDVEDKDGNAIEGRPD